MKRKIESQFLKWKSSSSSNPLMLYGARQVGKTFILRRFGKKHYSNTAYFNLESYSIIASSFDEDISLLDFGFGETHPRVGFKQLFPISLMG